MASTAPPAKAEAAGAPPAVEAERANDAERVATADLRAERQKRLPSPWTPDEPFSTNARSDEKRDEDLAVPSEERCTQLAARVLRATAELCGTPLSVAIAALVYLVVFYERPENAHEKDSPQDVVPACLLLASKIEEKPTRVSDVVNVMQRVLFPLRRDPLFLRTERARLAHASRDVVCRAIAHRAKEGDASDDASLARRESESFVPAGIGAPAEPASPKTTTFPPKGPATFSFRRAGEKAVEKAVVGDAEEPKESFAAPSRRSSPPEEERVTKRDKPPDSERAEILRSTYLRSEIARLKKKHPGLMPKSAYASALSRWRDAPENPESDAGKRLKNDTENQTLTSLRAADEAKPAQKKTLETSLETKKSFLKEKRRAAISDEGPDDSEMEIPDANFARSRPVIGDAYYETKDRVLRAEQSVLRAIDAEVNVVRVVSVLLNVARAVNAPKSVTKLALVALTDFVFETTTGAARGLFFGVAEDDEKCLPARTPLELAGDVSAAAVSVAARLCGYALTRDERGFARWTPREKKDAKEGSEAFGFSSSAEEANVGKRKRSSDETRLDVYRGDTGFPAPWWVEMEFDPKRVERVEKEMLRVLVRGAERSGAFLGE